MTTYTLLSPGRVQFIGANGAPLVGGLVYFYGSGSTTFKSTYQNGDASTLNTNPVVLDELGSATIWGSGLYRMVLQDSLGNVLWDQDTASFVPDDLSVVTLEASTSVTTPEYIITGVPGIAFESDGSNHILVGAKLIVPSGIGPAIIDSVAITNAPSITVSPTGNPTGNPPPPTLVSLNIQGVDSSAVDREFMLCVGFTTSHGATTGTSGASAAQKVGFYSGIQGIAGSGEVWAINTVTQIDSGMIMNAHGYELDFVNNSGDRMTPFPTSTQATAYGLNLSSGNTAHYKSTAALVVSSFVDKEWQDGLLFVNSSVNSAVLHTLISSDYIVRAEADTQGMGASYGTGIDFHTAPISGAAIYLGNTHYLAFANTSGTSDVCIAYNNGNNLVFGAGGTVQTLKDFVPAVPGGQQCGTSPAYWSAVSAVAFNTISDPKLKTEIVSLPPSTPLLEAISPITFKFLEGGQEEYEVEEEQEVQATELREEVRPHQELINGKWTLVTKTFYHEERLWDELPVYNMDGSAAMNVRPGHSEVKDDTGKVIREAYTGFTEPKTHKVPRMVKKLVKVTKHRPVPGKRTHWGFDAREIKRVMDAAGLDFGGHIVDPETDTHMLRPDQLISVLWQALKETNARLSALEAAAKPLLEG